MIILLAQNS